MRIKIIKKAKEDVWYNYEDKDTIFDAVFDQNKQLYKITDTYLLLKYSAKYNNLFKALWISEEYCKVVDDGIFKKELDKIFDFE